MATPLAGVTHDIVAHINNSQSVGLVVRPVSYRVGAVPHFAPQFTIGNVSAVDKSWLRSFRMEFKRGSGLRKSDNPNAVDRFYAGSMIVLDRDGQAMPGILPVQSSSLNNAPMELTSRRSVVMFTMSQATRMLVENIGLFTHTVGNSQGLAWVVSHTVQDGVDATLRPTAAVMHSGVAFIAFSNSNIGAYGLTGGGQGSRMYHPVFTNSETLAWGYTQAHRLYNYDKRLWKTNSNRIAYWDAPQFKWSDWVDVGDATYDISATETFIGRKFFGKPDGLWVFDAGRVYQIESYAADADVGNFALLIAYRGGLYFNVGKRLLRYTAGGAIEELPWPGEKIYGGAVGMGLLLISGSSKYDAGHVITGFNPDTGAFSEIFSSLNTSWGPLNWTHEISILQPGAEVDPVLWVGPVTLSAAASGVTRSPIARFFTEDQAWSPTQRNPFPINAGVILTPHVNMGIPGQTKQVSRVKVYYSMKSGNSIEVLYRADFIPDIVRRTMWSGTAEQNYNGEPFTITGSGAAIVASDGTFDMVYVGARTSLTDGWIPTVQYETAPGVWANVPTLYTNLYQLPLRFTIPERRSPPNMVGYIKFAIPSTWVKTNSYAADSYHIRLVSPTVLPVGDYVYLVGASPMLSAQFPGHYTSLGTVTDATTEMKELSVDPAVAAESLSFMIKLTGDPTNRPVLKALEVEYTVPETDKLQVAAVVLGIQPIQILDRSVENSAQWIATTLFSMWQSGKPFPVQLPFPFPVAHTRNMVLSVQPPGVTVPVLAYSHSFVGAEYSLLLREV